MTFLDKVKEWASHPYDDKMSVMGWFLFLGLLAIISFLWSRVLKVIVTTISEA